MTRQAAIELIEKGLQMLKEMEKPHEFEHPPKKEEPKPAPINPELKGYRELFLSASIKPEHKVSVKTVTSKILANISRYEIAAKEVNVPWYIIACIHNLESSMSFTKHLHNGDPLSARTTHDPAGRPIKGKPPFTWEESASDALKMKYEIYKDFRWSIEECLYFLERYNGMGYRNKGVLSPYLWSYTDKYIKGKYVADGKYDPNAVSKQVGAAAVLLDLDVFNKKLIVG